MNNRSKGDKDLFSRIRQLEKLTRTELMITKFFEANINQLAFLSLTALSEKAGVGKSSMVRFIKHRLCYDNFAQFQDERRDFMEQRLDSPVKKYVAQQSTAVSSDTEIPSAFSRHMAEALRHLQLTYESQLPESIETVAGYLSNPDSSIFMLGQRTSYSLAYMFYVNLLYIRPGIYMAGGPDSVMPSEIFSARKGDVSFVIHRKRYSQNTCDIAQQLKRQGVKIVLMTDSELSPLSSIADHQLVLPGSPNQEFFGDSAWVAVLESIFLSVADRYHGQDSSYTKTVESSLQRFFGIKDTHWS